MTSCLPNAFIRSSAFINTGIQVPLNTHVLTVNCNDRPADVVLAVTRFLQGLGGVNKMTIDAHGPEWPVEGSDARVMGGGIMLSNPMIDHNNVNLTRAWRGLVRKIKLHVCGVANTTRTYEGSPADGQEFCKRLALNTQAFVYGSDAQQPCEWINTHELIGELFRAAPSLHAALGFPRPIERVMPWNGNVWRFPPGGQPIQVRDSDDH